MNPKPRPTASMPSGAPAPRGGLAWCAGLFLSALVLRLVHVATIQGSPFSEHLMLDARMYDEWGQQIAAGNWLGDRPFFQDPLYAYLLGAVYAVFGRQLLPIFLIQAVLGALVCPLLFVSARRWSGVPAAAAAGVIAAVYLPSVYYEGMILKTSMAMFVVTVLLALLSRALATGDGRSWMLTGVAVGAACLLRGNLLLFLPVLCVWLVWSGTASAESASVDPSPRRPAWKAAGLVLLGCAIVLAPVALRNRWVGGEWILTTSNAGQNFFIGNNALNTSGEYQRLPFVDPTPKYEERGFAAEAQRRSGRSMTPTELSAFWRGEAWSWIRQHPADWAGLTWQKLRVYWGAYEIPDNLDYYVYRESAPVLRLPIPGFGLVAPLGLLGGLLVWRRRGWPRLLILFVIVYASSVVAFFVLSRFRMVMMPAMFLLAGSAIAEIVSRLRAVRAGTSAWWRLLPVAGAALALLIAVNLPVRGPDDSRTIRWARALGLPVRAESSATAHFNLGVSYAGQARNAADPQAMLQLAERELRRAATQERRFAEVFVELGKVMARQRKDEEAIAVYLHAAELEPNDYRTQHALGLLLRRIGDRVGAETRFRRALVLHPRNPYSAIELGELLLERGRNTEAADLFRHALMLSPGNEAAARGLRAAEPSGNAP